MASVPARVGPPDADFATRLRSLVADAVNSRESKRAYARAVDDLIDWFKTHRPAGGALTKATVQAYRSHLIESGLRTVDGQSAHHTHSSPGCGNGR